MQRNETMNPENKWLKVTGYVLNALIAALMLFAGSGKVFGFAPPQIIQQLNEFGFGDRIRLIGAGETISALLLLIPRTSPLGVLLTSGFWGGVICIHMAHHEEFYLVGCVLLALTWIGGYLRGSVPLLAVNPRRSAWPGKGS
jgi:hypothetical protein